VDLYLMGLKAKADVAPFFTINEPVNWNPAGVYVPSTGPAVGVSCHGRAYFWNVADLEAANGVRVPDYASAPHTFRVGFILVTPHGQGATQADLNELENIRGLMASTFATYTRDAGAIDASLDSHAGRVVIAHDAVHDQTNASATVHV